MHRLQFPLVATLILGLPCARTAAAQTATNITIVSGNGQLTCPVCVSPQRNTQIQPFTVKVTDASGNPVANQEVNWTVVDSHVSSSPSSLHLRNAVTSTDADGIASNQGFENPSLGVAPPGFVQANVTASLPTNNAAVVFTQTQTSGLVDPFGLTTIDVKATQVWPAQAETVQGVSGTTGTTPIQVHVAAFNVGIPGVAIRLIQERAADDPGTIVCRTEPGADAGAALTDANGDAKCYPIFGGTVGGSFNVLVGGVASDDLSHNGKPIGFQEFFTVPFRLSDPVVGSIQILSGNNQTVTQGQPGQTLAVKVLDKNSGIGLNGQSITWSVLPSWAGTLANTINTTDASGQASTDFSLASNATGTVQIKATLTNQPAFSAVFNIAAALNITVSGVTKVSGDQQLTTVGQPFAQPLVVQVNGGNNQGVPNFPVAFSISGPGTLSSSSVNTDANGRAQVTVTSTAQGPITVTATSGGVSQAFALTVVPAGPTLTVDSFVNAADLQRGAISPCGMASIVASGVAPLVQGVVLPSGSVGPLPRELAGVQVSFSNLPAPILNLSNINGAQRVTFQVPCDVVPGAGVPVTVSVNGASASVSVPVRGAAPGLYLTTMSDGEQRVSAVRPDGSFVTLENPARRGEIVRVFVTGLGPASPAVATNSLPVPGTDSNVLGQVIAGLNNAGTRLVSAKMSPHLIGVAEVAFQVPDDAPAGNDIVFSIAVNAPNETETRFSAAARIPIL